MNWSYLCDVDIAPLAAWLAEGDKGWPAPSTPCKPQRVREIPGELLEPIYEAVLIALAKRPEAFEERLIDGEVTRRIQDPMLSRMLPGQSHPFHVDVQRSDWITRVHVPITTNPGCWMAWECQPCHGSGRAWSDHGDGFGSPNAECDLCGGRGEERVHFAAGKAYSFNTLARHAFGNDGETKRVHLIFEVLRKDA